MTLNKIEIEQTLQAFLQALTSITTLEALEVVRITYLGRKGKITELMSQLKQLPVEQKRLLGPALQELRHALTTKIEAKKSELEQSKQKTNGAFFDVTAYEPAQKSGSLHVYSLINQQLEDIFISMGFEVVSGPELETDYYNFESLNIPADHPARDLQDTFWLQLPGKLLRTHTSTVQAHCMEEKELPLAIFAPGRVFRNEATDATHDFMFAQGEVMLIDKQISVANLLATAKAFLQEFFEKKDLKIRTRPGYFPFVEPGIEIDGSCPFCKKGCSVCKYTTWIELLGSGLVHPNVLRCSGINPEEYSGFAIGFGIARLAMLKYGINDIRLFHSDKLSFLEQF